MYLSTDWVRNNHLKKINVQKFGDSMILIINFPVINRRWTNYNDNIYYKNNRPFFKVQSFNKMQTSKVQNQKVQ